MKDIAPEQTMRLNKYLANLGICARRDVKQFLKANNVTVNGEHVREGGVRFDPHKDEVKINGNMIKEPELVYFLLNKPKGIISTTSDEYGRKNVTALVPKIGKIYPVGRLDKDTTGLILLTNDGELTNLLTHPSFHVDKTYRLTVKETPSKEQLRAMRNGVLLSDGITSPADVRIISSNNVRTVLEMTIHEGRNRQIRRMCETVGLELLELDRVTFGPLRKGTTPLGKFRELGPDEIVSLKNAAKRE
jgi:23S rRNA pseudouridine2605 synthase